MLKTRLNGTERPKKDAGLRRGVAAAVVLLIVCVLAVGAVSAADTVIVSDFAGLQNSITNAPDDLTIIVADNIEVSGSDAIPAITTNITLTTNNANHKIYRTGANTSSPTGMFIIQNGGKLTIQGNNSKTLTLDGNQTEVSDNGQPLVRVENGGNFTLANGGILTNNTANNGGGVYVNFGTFTMSGGEISGNTAVSNGDPYSGYGGGVYVNSGTFTMERGTISDNEAGSNGGGVYVDNSESKSGTFTMSGGTISGNTAGPCGGGVCMSGGTFTMSDNAAISDNTATSGGGVYMSRDRSSFTMSGGEISDNTASYGCGVYVDSGTFELSGGEISGNEASGYGGGVYVNLGAFTMSGGTISSNTASYGGGVYVGGSTFTMSGGTFTMSGGTISGNEASGYGGGVYVDKSGTFTMPGGEISGNTAEEGGGVYLEDGTFTMSDNAAISRNTADYNGGGVCMSGGTFTMSDNAAISGNAAISDNTADNGISPNCGGGVCMFGGTFEMSGGEISGNTADPGHPDSGGGGVYMYPDTLYPGTFDMSGGKISGNNAYCGGGVCVFSGGMFTMSDNAAISDNTASGSGGGVYMSGDGTFEMFGTAAISGGGVYVDSGTFKLSRSGSTDSVYLGFEKSITVTGDLTATDPQVTVIELADLGDGRTVVTGTPLHEDDLSRFKLDPSVTGFKLAYQSPDRIVLLPDSDPAPLPPSGGSSSDGNMENAFRVLFNDGATTLTVQTDLSYGDKLTKPEDPVKDGYTFAGWYKDSACTQGWDFETGIPGDMTLYAKWTAAGSSGEDADRSCNHVRSAGNHRSRCLTDPHPGTRTGRRRTLRTPCRRSTSEKTLPVKEPFVRRKMTGGTRHTAAETTYRLNEKRGIAVPASTGNQRMGKSRIPLSYILFIKNKHMKTVQPKAHTFSQTRTCRNRNNTPKPPSSHTPSLLPDLLKCILPFATNTTPTNVPQNTQYPRSG